MSRQRQLAFVDVISTLQGWLGDVIKASLDIGTSDEPVGCTQATGVLRASGDLFEPGYSLAEHHFELAAEDHLSGFVLHRDYFHWAIRQTDDLIFVRLGEPRGDPDRAPELAILRYYRVSSPHSRLA
jgi:hypothetical protein